MSTQPLISIIIPVYNVGLYLEECLKCVLAQTYQNFELILIDDGSKDCSGKLCDQYAITDRRIKVIHKQNGGVSSARNLGIKEAKGKWIAFVDSDDWITPNYIQDMVDDIKDENMLIFHNRHFKGELPRHTLPNKTFKDENIIKIIVSEGLMDESGPIAKLYNKSIIEKFNIEFPLNIHLGEDAIFILRYLQHVNSITFSNKSNYIIRRHEGSLTTRFYPFESEWNCFLIWKKEFSKLLKKYQNQNNPYTLWNTRVGEIFIRALKTIVHNKQYQSSSDMVKTLAQIPQQEYNEFLKYFFPSNKKGKILKLLIQLRFFRCFILLEKLNKIHNTPKYKS